MPRSSHKEFYAQSFIRLLCFLQSPPGGAASPLPDSPLHGQRGRCPSRAAKSCAKLSKPISGNHCPTRRTRPTRPTSPSAKREAQSLALHCSLQSAKLCEMGLCAPCRGASAVVLRFSCQRSNWLIPLPLSKCASTPSKLA